MPIFGQKIGTVESLRFFLLLDGKRNYGFLSFLIFDFYFLFILEILKIDRLRAFVWVMKDGFLFGVRTNT